MATKLDHVFVSSDKKTGKQRLQRLLIRCNERLALHLDNVDALTYHSGYPPSSMRAIESGCRTAKKRLL